MEKIWLNYYPKGVPHEINNKVFSSIADMFEQTTKKYRRKTALHSLDVNMSYGELEAKTKCFAAYLQHDLGLKKGDRIAIMLPNCMQFIIALFAALRIGLIVVNINPLYTPRELIYQLNDSGAETIIVLSNFAKTVEESLPEVKLKNVIVTDITDIFSGVKGVFANFVMKHVKKIVPNYNIPNVIKYKHALSRGYFLKLIPVDINREDIALLQYTGGTTGVSKGAMLTHSNIVSNVEQTSAWMGKNMVLGEETIITALPLYHIFALMVNCFTFFKCGFKNVLIPNAKDIPGLIKEMSKHKFSILSGVNTMFKALLRHRSFLQLDFHNLKLTIGGGMSIHRNVAELWYEVTGTVLIEGYGLTESSPCCVCNPYNYSMIYTGAIGLPMPSTEVKIIDKQGEDIPMGERGELCIRGPQVMKGYWNMPEETKEVLTDDRWLKTGDIATMDGRGYLYIVDRKKDIIVVSGYNVYPNEVERVISEHPEVFEVAVIGEQSDKTGEVIKAYVVRKENSTLTREDLVKFCRDKMTFYKIPRRFEFCDQLPKSNVGKILRSALRNERFREKHVK